MTGKVRSFWTYGFMICIGCIKEDVDSIVVEFR